ncbi:MAG: S41 family peptidase [Parcubacteria group bacterium]|nr:S41 family peptidase [Parcubacteria group bacterium]
MNTDYNTYTARQSFGHRRYRPHALTLIIIFLLAAGSFGIGVQYGRSTVPSLERITSLSDKETGKPDQVDFSLFWDAWRTVEEKYVDREHLDRTQLVYGAIEGMVQALGDPYSVFLPPEEHKRFEEDINGSFSGIGAEIGIKDEVLTIIAPLPGSPAEKAGLRAGDTILKIDGKQASDLTVDEAVQKIRGEKGTTVRLTITRKGLSDGKEIVVTRDVITIPPLTTERTSSPGRTDDVMIIRLLQFSQQASDAFEKTARQILASDVERIVLDVRNNPGGYLDVAVDIASWFLPPGETVVIEEGSDRREEHRTTRRGQLQSYPVVVLVNGGSASASEILAGALRDHRDVQLVGEKTFGKGSVQRLESLREDTALKITIAKWLTPNGTSLEKNGLEPSVIVEMTEDDARDGTDPQRARALEIVGTLSR